MSRRVTILAALLALQAALIAGRMLAGGEGAARAGAAGQGEAILRGVEKSAVAKIAIQDAHGGAIEIERSGDGFVVASAAGYPAKRDSVDRLLDKLLGLRSVAVAAASPKSHAGLDVSEARAQRDVRLLDAGGGELARLLLGRSVAGGAFVRRAGEDEVHRVGEPVTYDASTAPASYIDTQLVSVEPANVTRVAITRAATETASIVLERLDGDRWRVHAGGEAAVDLPAAKDKAEETARQAGRVWFTKPVAAAAAPEHGLERPAIVVETRTKDGAITKLEIGAKTPDGSGRYARKAGSLFVVELTEYTAGQFEKDLDHFREKPPETPAPAPAAAPPGPPPAAAPAAPDKPPAPPGPEGSPEGGGE